MNLFTIPTITILKVPYIHLVRQIFWKRKIKKWFNKKNIVFSVTVCEAVSYLVHLFKKQLLPFKRLIQMIAFSLYGLFCSVLHGDKSSVRWMSALLTDYCEDDCPSRPLRTSDSLCRHYSVISATVLMDFFACADLKIDWTGFGLHSTQGINVFNHFHWNDSQAQPMMVFLCVCPKDMNLQGNGKTCKVP